MEIWMHTPWTRVPPVSRWSCAFPRAHVWPTAAVWPDTSVISKPVMFGIIETVMNSRSIIYYLFKCFLCRISIKSGKHQFYRCPNLKIRFKTMYRTKQVANLVVCSYKWTGALEHKLWPGWKYWLINSKHPEKEIGDLGHGNNIHFIRKSYNSNLKTFQGNGWD